MTTSYTPLPSLPVLKDQARRLRASLDATGQPISHCRALELVAHQHGFRDWNTLHARLGNRPRLSPYTIGARVAGSYLGQRFSGEVISAGVFESDPTRIRLTPERRGPGPAVFPRPAPPSPCHDPSGATLRRPGRCLSI